MKEDHFDPYLDQNGVLINKLGIKDEKALLEKEARITAVRAAEIESETLPDKFDFDHLKYIHRRLFGDVYEWAGKIRHVDISKENTIFCLKDNIESFADYTFKRIALYHKTTLLAPDKFKDQMPEELSHYFGEINALHPFREGNGRAQKIFIGHLARAIGVNIVWSKMTQYQLISASKEAMIKEPNQLTKLIRSNSYCIKIK